MQRLEIVARACELIVRPNETPEDGKTTRTIEELMDEVIRRGIVPDISWSSVQRILAGLEVKPHKTEQWFHSPDPEFRPKVTAICDLYLKPPPAGLECGAQDGPGSLQDPRADPRVAPSGAAASELLLAPSIDPRPCSVAAPSHAWASAPPRYPQA